MRCSMLPTPLLEGAVKPGGEGPQGTVTQYLHVGREHRVCPPVISCNQVMMYTVGVKCLLFVGDNIII